MSLITQAFIVERYGCCGGADGERAECPWY